MLFSRTHLILVFQKNCVQNLISNFTKKSDPTNKRKTETDNVVEYSFKIEKLYFHQMYIRLGKY